MTIKIEDNIELPDPAFKIKWGFGKLEVGQSFAITFDDEREVVRLRTAASAWNQRHRVRLTTRTVYEDGIKKLRVWRVA